MATNRKPPIKPAATQPPALIKPASPPASSPPAASSSANLEYQQVEAALADSLRHGNYGAAARFATKLEALRASGVQASPAPLAPAPDVPDLPLPMSALIAEIKTDDGKLLGVMTLPPKVFKTGSKGFYGNAKQVYQSKRYQIQVQLVEIGSKQ